MALHTCVCAVAAESGVLDVEIEFAPYLNSDGIWGPMCLFDGEISFTVSSAL